MNAEIANMFFGGGMGGMHGMHRGPGGVHFSTNFGGMPQGFRQARQRGQQQQQQQQQAPGLANLIQLLPLLMIILLSFFGSNEYEPESTRSAKQKSPGLNRYFTLSVSTFSLVYQSALLK